MRSKKNNSEIMREKLKRRRGERVRKTAETKYELSENMGKNEGVKQKQKERK